MATARRCSFHATNWPDEDRFHFCPRCTSAGRVTETWECDHARFTDSDRAYAAFEDQYAARENAAHQRALASVPTLPADPVVVFVPEVKPDTTMNGLPVPSVWLAREPQHPFGLGDSQD